MKSRKHILVASIAAIAVGIFVWPSSDNEYGDSGSSDRNNVAKNPDGGTYSDKNRFAEHKDTSTNLAKTANPSAIAPHLVGKAVCKECHQENFDLHSVHGHAHTFHVLNQSPEIIAKFAGKTFDGGERFGTYHYQAEFDPSQDSGVVQNLKATLPAVFGDEAFPLTYALGSGHNAYTLLTLITEENGETAALEHRASWYQSQDAINITPGHANKLPADGLELFGSISRGDSMEKCVDCHTTSAKIQNEQILDLIPSVNCEKCHGPGSEHVRLAREQSVPPAYSVGRDDWDAESEIQLCGDCHRLPKNISEKELREYPDLLARFQPIGMLRSRCYLESDGELRCTTCHGPHESLHQVSEERHIQNCLNCHTAPNHTLCPVSPREDCIRCHMPALEQEQGLTFHDHWIRVR